MNNLILGSFLLLCAFYDGAYKRVPKLVTFCAIFAGIGIRLYSGTLKSCGFSIPMVAFFSLIGVWAYRVKVMGAGDVRTLWAIIAISGVHLMWVIFKWAVYIAVAWIAFTKILRIAGLNKKKGGQMYMSENDNTLPFAVFLLLGYAVYVVRNKFGI